MSALRQPSAPRDGRVSQTEHQNAGRIAAGHPKSQPAPFMGPKARNGDAQVRHHIARWRSVTARLQVLINTGHGAAALAYEAHALSRQCERLAAELARKAQRPAATHAADGDE
jgi:hypothetical protein